MTIRSLALNLSKLMASLNVLGEVSDVCTDIVGLLNRYFSSLVFVKLEQKESVVLYGACIASGLAGGYKRYIIAMVPIVKAHLDKCKLHELMWKVLQVRVLYQSYRLREQAWKMTRDMGDMILRVKSRDSKSSHYQPESCVGSRFPQTYEIVLLHDPKKKTQYQYNNRITLSAAVETFHMIFSIVDSVSRPPHPPPHPPIQSSSSIVSSDAYVAPEMRGWDSSYQSGTHTDYMHVSSQNHQLVSYDAPPPREDEWYETPVPSPHEDAFERI